MRHPEVIKRLDEIIDDLIARYGVEYFKFDYNIEVGIGAGDCCESFGDTLLDYGRALVKWTDGIKKRYPNVLIETCSSGGHRLDYMSLYASDLVSTSDQTDYLIYPYIATNVPICVLPEQAAVWSYPVNYHPETIDSESIAMNMVNALTGRIHLASKLYNLSDELKIIKKGISYSKKIASIKNGGVPFYPCGISSFGDKKAVLGFREADKAILYVYGLGEEKIKISIPDAKSIKVGYPEFLNTDYNYLDGVLTLMTGGKKIARIFEINY